MKRQELKDKLIKELDVNVQDDGAFEVGDGGVVLKTSIRVGNEDILFVVRESAVPMLVREGLISMVRKSSMRRYVFRANLCGKQIIEASSLREAIKKLQPPASYFFVEEEETGKRFYVNFNDSIGQWVWTKLRKRRQKRNGGAVNKK